MTKEDFNKLITDKISTYPEKWRKGQKVFNAAEEVLWNITNNEHNIAREVQFLDGIDCFYNDKITDEFLNKCWERLSSYGY